MKQIYEKVCNGDSLTDEEVLKGMKFYRQLTNDLMKCGPVFALARNEANRTYMKLYDFAQARGLRLPRVY